MSDFSIRRILSPEFGFKPAAARWFLPALHSGSTHPSGFAPPSASNPPIGFAPPSRSGLPGPVQFPDRSCGDGLHALGRTLHHLELPNPGGLVIFRSKTEDAALLTGFHGYHHLHHAAAPEKVRLRTVFTATQNRRLEALFQTTPYPRLGERAEAAQAAGLSQETVRVWFKNRRARGKRQVGGSKVKPPPPAAMMPTERKIFSSLI